MKRTCYLKLIVIGPLDELVVKSACVLRLECNKIFDLEKKMHFGIAMLCTAI